MQILNSFGVADEDLNNRDCGCLYGMKKPDKLVCKPAGEWQSFDIAFRAARFDGAQKVENARITVYHNGTKVIDNIAMEGLTGAALKDKVVEKGPTYLQGNHGTVFYRNIFYKNR